MRFYLIIAFGFIILNSTVIYSQNYNSLLNKSYAERQLFLYDNFYMNKLIINDSIAYFREVEKLKKVAEESLDKELLLEITFLKYSFLSSRNYKNYEQEMLAFKSLVDEEKIIQLQIRVRQALGFNYYFQKKDYTNAIINFSESYEFLRKVSVKNFPDKQESVYNIAWVYHKVGYDDIALEYLEIAEKLSNHYYKNMPIHILNTKGLIHQNRNEWELAEKCFKKVYDFSVSNHDEIWIRISEVNLARIYYLQKQYNKAESLLKKYLNENKYITEKIAALEILSNIYILQNKNDEAYNAIKQIESSFNNEKAELKRLNALLPLFAYKKQKEGKYKEAYFIADSALSARKQYYEEIRNAFIEKSAHKETIEKYLKTQLEIENKQKILKITRISLSAIIFLLIIIAVILIQRQRILHKKQKAEFLLKNQLINSELNYARKQLTDLTNSLLNKQVKIEKYKKELNELQENAIDNEETIKRKETLNNLLNQAILTNENWLNFKKAFENVYPDYFNKLNSLLPGLTQAEIRYIILRKLNLTHKEIASILGVVPNAVRLYKFRILKKFSLEDDGLNKIIEDCNEHSIL